MPARHLVWSKLRGQTPEPGRLTGSSPRTCHGSQAEREKTWRSKQAVDDELCRRAALGTARREACAWLGHGTGSRWRAFQQRGRPDRRADGSEVKAGQGRRRRMEAQGRGGARPRTEQAKIRVKPQGTWRGGPVRARDLHRDGASWTLAVLPLAPVRRFPMGDDAGREGGVGWGKHGSCSGIGGACGCRGVWCKPGAGPGAGADTHAQSRSGAVLGTGSRSGRAR